MRISHSAKNTWLECQFKYFLHYFMKLRPVKDKSSFVFGDCIDHGLNHLLETRNLDEAIQKFQERWEKRAKAGNIQYSKADLEEHLVEDQVFKNNDEKTYASLLKKGEILLKEYDAQIMHKIKRVIKVQIDETMYNEDEDELVIKTDFICEWENGQIILFDNKTSSVKYENNSVKLSPQLAIYYEALKEEYKIDKCGYIVIPKKINKKKEPKVLISVIIDDILQSTIDSTHGEFETALKGIKSGSFSKNEKNCISIYGKCTYYDYCHNKSKKGLEEKKDI